MITWMMVGLLLAAETCGRNVLSGNGNGNGKEETKRQEDLKGVSADEEDIYRLTCYTCVNVSDNQSKMFLFPIFLQMCNEWAIDTPCPAGGRDFCRSLHILDSRGNSVSKSCASSEECGPASVGCIPVDTQQPGRGFSNESEKECEAKDIKRDDERKTREMKRSIGEKPTEPGEINSVISFQICISCCDLSYCNIESPTNATNAIYSRKRRAKSKPKRKRPGRNGVDAATRLYGSGLLWLPASLFYAYHC
ncbi:hypothetical protein X777_07837 [Ooceraea biroi]|uniref:Uncharacterized protein n=1 Tax=Ooceraea biroi TaxID=2015173 RepID=A0A026X279_OOCBI|nr:hypothetical protein X777_07837 [Ooceraea biroi]